MGTTTTKLGMYKPSVGETGWGTLVDGNFDTLDSLSGGTSKVYNAVTDYGATAAIRYTDGVTFAASTTFTSATAAFTAADVGKRITIYRCGVNVGANYGSGSVLCTTISSVSNGTTVVLANAAKQAITGAYFYIFRAGVQTTAIQAAIDAASAAGGGRAYLPRGYYLSAQLVLKTGVTLCGDGSYATMLRLQDGTNADFIKNYVSSNGTTDPNGQFCGLQDIGLNGNKLNNSSGRGVFLDQNPAWSQASADIDFEPHWRFSNFYIEHCKGNALELTDCRSGGFFYGIETRENDGVGIKSWSDSLFMNFNIGWSGTQGIWIAGNSYYANGFSYYSGQITATSGYGFYLTGAQGSYLANCRAQDNTDIGFNLDGCKGCHMVACCADSNSTRSAGAVPGIDLWGANYNTILLNSIDRKNPATQQSAARLRNSSTGNYIVIGHYSAGAGTVGVPLQSGTDLSSGNSITINGMGGMVTPAFATTYTPNPYAGTIHKVGALTNNITLAAPSNAHMGCDLRIWLVQDGTGGRTVTWNGVYSTTYTNTGNTAGKKLVVDFVYDGTVWQQTDIQSWI